MANKDIEIPFGAYDSELGGFEYTIPEGYKAEIKDGKVVVRKTESEDERIRKRIIALVNAHGQGMYKDEMLAWLEKQGKNNMGISEATKQKLEDNLNEALEKETPESFNAFLDEQKPAETEKGTNGNERKIPNSAWSEEDERIKKCIINFLRLESSRQNIDADWFPWLKSLKDRVQPKQEWSGEDERIIENLVSQLGNLYARKLIKEETKDKYVDWLKSPRPQTTWKPSDEQIKALNYVVNIMASSERPTENDLYYNILKSLRQ